MRKWNAIDRAVDDQAETYTMVADMNAKNAYSNDKALGRDTLASPITFDEAMAVARKNTFRKELARTAIATVIAMFCY